MDKAAGLSEISGFCQGENTVTRTLVGMDKASGMGE